MRMCWSVQLPAALVRAMWTATATHTAGIHMCTTVLSLCRRCAVCVYFCRWVSCTGHVSLLRCVQTAQILMYARWPVMQTWSATCSPFDIHVPSYPLSLQPFWMPHCCCREAVQGPRETSPPSARQWAQRKSQWQSAKVGHLSSMPFFDLHLFLVFSPHLL